MLDPDMWEQYDRYKLAYSNILYNWRLFNQRAVILKFISTTLPQHKGVGKFIEAIRFITMTLDQHEGKFIGTARFITVTLDQQEGVKFIDGFISVTADQQEDVKFIDCQIYPCDCRPAGGCR